MTISKILLCCFLTSFAVHYGWRMRGTVIGGEKGAMLPGMLAGIILALFGGNEIASRFIIPAAAGLIGMTYGGTEPYGDTIALAIEKYGDPPNPARGYKGLALKGALWFSVSGGIIGMSFSAMGGRYSAYDILIFCGLIHVFQLIGYILFNRPYDYDNGVFPKIYFSYESREEWGSNVGITALIIAFSIIRKDFIALPMCLSGFFFGAIGWLIAIRLYYYTENPFRNGRYLFGKLSEKKILGGWENMEFCLGSIGGLGLALGYVIAYKSVTGVNAYIASNGVFSPFSGYENLSVIISGVLFVILLCINVFELVCDSKGRKYNSFIMDCIERPFFSSFPLIPVLLCSEKVARLMTLFMIIYVLCIKNCFDRLKPEQHRKAFMALSAVICAALFAFCVSDYAIGPVIPVLAGGIPYICAEIFWAGTNQRRGGWKNVFSFNGFSLMMLLLLSDVIIISAAVLLIT